MKKLLRHRWISLALVVPRLASAAYAGYCFRIQNWVMFCISLIVCILLLVVGILSDHICNSR